MRVIARSVWIVLGAALALQPLTAQPMEVDFPSDYVESHRGRNDYLVTPGLELANILVAVAFRDADIQFHPMRRKWAYYQEVLEQFAPFASHPVFEGLGLDPDNLSTYSLLRNSGYRWYLCGDEWCHHEFLGPWWPGDVRDVFTENIELIADFAATSGFHAFYEEHQPYYERLSDLYESRVDLDEMIAWLSLHFDSHYDAYTVLYSPLILGNQAVTRKLSDEFSQVFMLVDPPLETEDMNRALNSFKWVFTELDHQFVNPESDRHAERIEATFSNRELWTAGKQSVGYKSGMQVFNEYMTWAVYVAYIDDHFDQETATAHTEAVIEFMEERRGFALFGEFVRELRSQRVPTDRPLSQTYPELLRWAETRAGSEVAG